MLWFSILMSSLIEGLVIHKSSWGSSNPKTKESWSPVIVFCWSPARRYLIVDRFLDLLSLIDFYLLTEVFVFLQHEVVQLHEEVSVDPATLGQPYLYYEHLIPLVDIPLHYVW